TLGWNHKKVARLIQQLGLKALIRATKAYRHPALGEISDHLLTRLFPADKPTANWLPDFPALPAHAGPLSLSPLFAFFTLAGFRGSRQFLPSFSLRLKHQQRKTSFFGQSFSMIGHFFRGRNFGFSLP
ncbi:hypothetical protein ACTHSY_11770, partial [Neisseria sp. P0013.S004]